MASWAGIAICAAMITVMIIATVATRDMFPLLYTHDPRVLDQV